MQAVTPAARLETVFALLRATTAVLAVVPLALAGATDLAGRPVSTALPITLHLLYGLFAAGTLLAARRCETELQARALGAATTAFDVGFFAIYCLLCADLPGVGSAAGLLALVGGPARFGAAGAAATYLPVTLTALVWPSPDAAGRTLEPAATIFVALLVSVAATVVTLMVRHATSASRHVQQQMHGAFENASIGMALLDPDGTVVRLNPALAEFLGGPVRSLYDAVTPEDRVRLRTALADLAGGRRPGVRLEARFLRPGGDEPWGLIAASVAPEAGRVVLQVEDISERKAYEAILSERASLDPLTGLPNRLVLLDRLDRMLAREERCAVLFVDLDGFKKVNDLMSHRAGDELLVEVARRFERLVRPGDLVARIGGDEFVVLCARTDLDGATALARRVATALRIVVGGIEVSASVGVAPGRPGASAGAVLHEADVAMYRAKTAGGDGHVVARESRSGQGWPTADEAGRYRLMLDLARDVTGCLDLATVLDASFAAMRKIVDFDGGSIALVGGDDCLALAATDPPATPEAMASRLPVGQGIAGRIVVTGEPAYNPDVVADPAVPERRRRTATSPGLRSWFGVPLVAEGAVIGVFQIDSRVVDAWSEADRLAVLAFTPIVASAVSNALRFEREVAALLG